VILEHPHADRVDVGFVRLDAGILLRQLVKTAHHEAAGFTQGGRLVILDLLSHRFERARELYADQWLGFSEVQLHQWLEEAGFGKLEVRVVSREKESPHFQTVFATGSKEERVLQP